MKFIASDNLYVYVGGKDDFIYALNINSLNYNHKSSHQILQYASDSEFIAFSSLIVNNQLIIGADN